MADKELQTILNSGGVNTIYLGGTSSTHKVQKKSDMTGGNVSFDDAGLGISAASVQAALAILGEVGFMVMTGNSMTPQTIGTSATKVNTFDTLMIQEGVGVEGNIADDKAIVTLDGVFKIRFEAFISYSVSVDIEWQIYKNGSPFGTPITLSGQGSTPFPILRLASANLVVDDYVELYATASSSTDITIAQASGAMEKTIF